MKDLSSYEFWFLTGSQDLYGKETLMQVAVNSKKIVEALNTENGKAIKMPYKIVWKPTLKDSSSIYKTIAAANAEPKCAGIICWMHTFSPAKMWIAGLKVLDKPMLELNTQFNEKIPYQTMDMDFMNLNQAAHGDREFGFITSRMDINRKVIAGHWSHAQTRNRMAVWMRCAVAASESKSMVIVRFGDNMREVAVTDGDKVEAMIKLGWSVPYYGIGDLVKYMKRLKSSTIDALIKEYEKKYTIVLGKNPDFTREQIREQAKIELALRRFLKETGASAVTTNFQDLHGLKQLPGLAIQRLMEDGYGFAGEGDWKTAGMVRLLKIMGDDIAGDGYGSSFMEDYTYHMEEGNMLNLGSHMLEVCPSVADAKPTIEVHPLGIGGKSDPARIVFTGKAGKGFCTTIVDMGNRFRIVLNEIETITPEQKFEKLPVARVMWKPLPDFITSAEAWILAGGGHHTAYTNLLTTEYIRDFAEIVGIELIAIDKNTTIPQIRNELRWNSVAYK
ncbi:MAG: L-arabinose isomerase [Treponemataceae bacterium]